MKRPAGSRRAWRIEDGEVALTCMIFLEYRQAGSPWTPIGLDFLLNPLDSVWRNLTLVLILTNTLENQGFPAGASLPFQLRSPISGGDGTPPWTMPDSRR